MNLQILPVPKITANISKLVPLFTANIANIQRKFTLLFSILVSLANGGILEAPGYANQIFG